MLKKHRRNIGEASEKHRRNNEKTMEKQQGDSREDLSGTQKQILELLSKDTRLSAFRAEILKPISENLKNVVYWFGMALQRMDIGKLYEMKIVDIG